MTTEYSRAHTLRFVHWSVASWAQLQKPGSCYLNIRDRCQETPQSRGRDEHSLL